VSSTPAGPPAWLQGVWTRQWIERAGVRTDPSDVHYLQTPTYFGDARVPRDRPSFPHAASFADLTDAELRLLAQQKGFTGHTTVAGDNATWHHQIDYQPPDGTDDVGRIEPLAGARMYEHALDGSYIEAWRAISTGEGRFLVVRVERAGRLHRVLILVGDYFLYARNRAHDLPVAESLDALVAAAGADRAQIVAYLDCEFSTGRAHGGAVPWEIQHSTLPWRERQSLDFVDGLGPSQAPGGLAPRAASTDTWTVPVDTLSPADLRALFPPRP
jgi:hypothetical protein